MRTLIAGLTSIAIVVATRQVATVRAEQAPAQAPSGPQAPTMVAHPQHIQPGLAQQQPLASLTNPYEGDAQRTAEGGKLYVAYNCVDCHGADGSGFMGPSFQDSRWHFGGSAGEVLQSIYEGRPEGMPAWGGRIGDEQIWRLVAYVRSLSKGHDVATENFTGKTIKRMGH
jgi:cytochrome c oxidase cbb3-type subunit 3